MEEIHIDDNNILTEEQKGRVRELLARRWRSFSTDSKVPGRTHLLQVAIDLKPGATPFRHAPSRVGPEGEAIIDKAVSEMEEAGIIRKSTSQWASRVVLVSKKSGEARFCVDLRDLNSRLVVLDTPLPRTDDAIDRLGSTAGKPYDAIDDAPRALQKLGKNLIYHTLDLTAGFWNLPVRDDHRDRLAFVTSKGKYEFNRLPFGLMTGPSYAQRMIEATLHGLAWEICLPYIDDVAIWANGDTDDTAFAQAMERLELVLERIEWAGLRCKPKKCHLFATSVEYLGHICSREGVSLDPKKISAVKDIDPTSINSLEQVRSFLGMVGYYRNHIENFHVISSPLVDLTKAGVDVPTESQKPAAQAAVRALIDAMCSDPVLAYPRSDRDFILSTDAATGTGIGAVLKQLDDDGKERPVAFYGRRFTKPERNYTVTECELLGVVEACKHFRPYLWGRHFRVITDHSALRWLHTMKESVSGGVSSRLTRWTLRLQEHDYTVEHKPGKKHCDADGISRLVSAITTSTTAVATDTDTSDAIHTVRQHIARAAADALASGHDPLGAAQNAASIAASVAFRPPDDATGATTTDAIVAANTTSSGSASTTDPVKDAVALRESIQKSYLQTSMPNLDGMREAQLADPLCSAILTSLATGLNPPDPKQHRFLHRAVIHQGLLHREVTINQQLVRQLWIPQSLTDDVLHAFHDQSGHRHRHATFEALRRAVYWPGMFDSVVDHCLRCHECAFAKRLTGTAAHRQGESTRPAVGTYPFDCLVCDVLDMTTKLGATPRGNTKLVVFADSLTRWVEAIPVASDPTSEEILDLFITHVYSRYGFPRTVRSDLGSNLTSKLVKSVYDYAGIEMAHSTAHHHESAGVVERINDTLCGMVRASSDQGKAWDDHHPFLLFADRSSPHSITRESPAYLLYGRELSGPHTAGLLDGPLPARDPASGDYLRRFAQRLRAAWAVAYHLTRDQQNKDRDETNRRASLNHQFEVGDRVLLRKPASTHVHKLADQWDGPYRIADGGVLPDGNYRLTDLKDRRSHSVVHADRLKLYLTITDADRLMPDEYLVDSLLDRRGQGNRYQYLVKWRGYPKSHATWEPRQPLLQRCQTLIDAMDSQKDQLQTTRPAASAPSPAQPPGAPTDDTADTAPSPDQPSDASNDRAADVNPPIDSAAPSQPNHAKLVSGQWMYRYPFQTRKGIVQRYCPEKHMTAEAIEAAEPLRRAFLASAPARAAAALTAPSVAAATAPAPAAHLAAYVLLNPTPDGPRLFAWNDGHTYTLPQTSTSAHPDNAVQHFTDRFTPDAASLASLESAVAHDPIGTTVLTDLPDGSPCLTHLWPVAISDATALWHGVRPYLDTARGMSNGEWVEPHQLLQHLISSGRPALAAAVFRTIAPVLYLSTLTYATELPLTPLPEVRYRHGQRGRVAIAFVRNQPGRRWDLALLGSDDAAPLNRLHVRDIQLSEGPSAAIQSLAASLSLPDATRTAFQFTAEAHPHGHQVVRDQFGSLHLWVVASPAPPADTTWVPLEEFELAALRAHHAPLASALGYITRTLTP